MFCLSEFSKTNSIPEWVDPRHFGLILLWIPKFLFFSVFFRTFKSFEIGLWDYIWAIDNNSVRVCVLSHFSSVQLFVTHGLLPARLLCPQDSPGKNTEMGCHDLLQEIFSSHGSNPHLSCLLHWQVVLYHLGFPHMSAGKESTCNAGDPGWFLGWEDPLERDRLPIPVFLGSAGKRNCLQCGRPGFER